MKNLPNLSSRWSSSNSVYFRIKKLEYVDDKIWVHYRNEKTNQQYSCLVEAFLLRFKEELT